MRSKNQTRAKKRYFFAKKKFSRTKKSSYRQKQQKGKVLKKEKYPKHVNDSINKNKSLIPASSGGGYQTTQYRTTNPIELNISNKSSFGYDVSDKKMIVGNNPRYFMMERIGNGAFSEVFRCFDKQTQTMVAIKKQPLNSTTISLIAREVAVMKVLSSEIAPLHEGSRYIVKCLDSFIDGQLKAHYIVMEYTNLGDLYSFTTSPHYYKTKAQKEMFVKKILYEVGLGLKFMHGLKVGHRDIKLENILLFPVPNNNKPNNRKYLTSQDTNSFICKITDFGFATYFDKDGGTDASMGSLPYAAPELCMQGIHSYTLPDVWALGVCLYSALTEAHPFTTGQETTEGFIEDMSHIIRLQMIQPVELLKYSCTFTRLFNKIFVKQSVRPTISQILANFNQWFVDNDMIIRHWTVEHQTANIKKKKNITSRSSNSIHHNISTNKTHKRSLSEEKREYKRFDEHLVLSLSWPNSLDDEKKKAQIKKYSNNNISGKSSISTQAVDKNKNIDDSDQINTDFYPFTHSSLFSSSSSSTSSSEDENSKLIRNYVEFYMNGGEVTNDDHNDHVVYQTDKKKNNKPIEPTGQKIVSKTTEVGKSHTIVTANQNSVLLKLDMTQLTKIPNTNRNCTTDIRKKTNQKAIDDVENIDLNLDVPTSEPKRKTTGSAIEKKSIPKKNLSTNRFKKRKTRKTKKKQKKHQ